MSGNDSTEPQTMSQSTTSALADGLFWYAEKLRFGYYDIEPNQAEALRIYKQAASLGHAKANLRMGKCIEQGIGTERYTTLALTHYAAAWKIGASEGLAGVGGLLFRSDRLQEANRYWNAFFERIIPRKNTAVMDR